VTKSKTSREVFDKIFRKRYFAIIPILIIVVLAQLTHNEIKSTNDQFPKHGDTYENSGGIVNVGARNDICSNLAKQDGYLLITGSVVLDVVGNAQGFLQTDDEEFGLFFELDDRLLRTGIPLADGTTGRNGFDIYAMPGKINFVIMLKGNGDLTLIANRKSTMAHLPPMRLRCNNFRVGAGNEQETFTGRIDIQLSTGTNSSIPEELINQYSKSWNIDSFIVSNNSILAFVAGLLIIFGNPFKTQKQEEESQTELV